MNSFSMTRHAAARQQQRCVPPLAIEWLLSYGRREKSFDAVRVSFDKRAKKDLARDVGSRAVSLMSKYLTAALVIDPANEQIITVEWLH